MIILRVQTLIAVLGIFFCLSTQLSAQSESTDPKAPTSSEPQQDKKTPATTTKGPEGSEIHSDEEIGKVQKTGVHFSIGQTLLSGDEASSQKGFNNAIGASLGVVFQFRDRLNLLLEYGTSTHEGIQTSGNLKRSHVVGKLHYYFSRGAFSSFGITGAGVYFSNFNPGVNQKEKGLESSATNTFGLIFGIGGELEVSENFDLGLNAIRHHSFKHKNSVNGSEEAVPLTTIGLIGTFYFK